MIKELCLFVFGNRVIGCSSHGMRMRMVVYHTCTCCHNQSWILGLLICFGGLIHFLSFILSPLGLTQASFNIVSLSQTIFNKP